MRISVRFKALVLTLMTFMCAWSVNDGKWRGELDVRNVKLPLVFNFSNRDGALECTLDSPLQNAYGIPAKVDYESSDSIAVSISAIGASFRGSVEDTRISGIFEQRGMAFPLLLTPEIPIAERRPQTPIPPYPYETTDTVFNSTDGTPLAGTLTFPVSGTGNSFPMVVMVTGSGQQNRDEEIFEHRPFAVIADYLARRGIASFRYDDRGTGASGGTFKNSTTDIFLQDAVAALKFARGVDGVGKAGILGHSEGGTIAFMAASEGLPDFIISLAGMAVSGKETLIAQNRHSMENGGLPKQTIDDALKVVDCAFSEIAERTSEGVAVKVDVDSIVGRMGVNLPTPLMQQIKSGVANLNPWFCRLLTIDVRPTMSAIKCPVLALNGELDTQVDAASNLDAIKEGIRGAETHALPELNHLFQHAATGEIAEYQEIRETISPEVLQLIGDFIARQR